MESNQGLSVFTRALVPCQLGHQWATGRSPSTAYGQRSTAEDRRLSTVDRFRGVRGIRTPSLRCARPLPCQLGHDPVGVPIEDRPMPTPLRGPTPVAPAGGLEPPHVSVTRRCPAVWATPEWTHRPSALSHRLSGSVGPRAEGRWPKACVVPLEGVEPSSPGSKPGMLSVAPERRASRSVGSTSCRAEESNLACLRRRLYRPVGPPGPDSADGHETVTDGLVDRLATRRGLEPRFGG